MNIQGAYRIPTFLYESLWDLTIMYTINPSSPTFLKQGEVFLAYVAWYAAGRFVIEGMRTDSLMLGPIRVSQLLSVIFFVGALVIWIWRRYHQGSKLPWYIN